MCLAEVRQDHANKEDVNRLVGLSREEGGILLRQLQPVPTLSGLF